jgi:hypothetical protein
MKVTKSKKVYIRLERIQHALNEVMAILSYMVNKEENSQPEVKKEVKKTRRKKKE